MSTIFERVEDEEWIRKNEKEHTSHHIKSSHQLSVSVLPSHPQADHANREEMIEIKEKARRQTEEKERYKAKVKEYTHYLIGRKIPESAPTYS